MSSAKIKNDDCGCLQTEALVFILIGRQPSVKKRGSVFERYTAGIEIQKNSRG